MLALLVLLNTWERFPRYWFSKMYHDIPRFQRFGFIDSQRCTMIPTIDLPNCPEIPRFIQIYPKHIQVHKRSRLVRNYSDSKIIKKYARCSRISQDATMSFSVLFFNPVVKARCVDTFSLRFQCCCSPPFPTFPKRSMSKSHVLSFADNVPICFVDA